MKMQNYFRILILGLALLLLALPVCAAEVSGSATQCGETMTWSYAAGVLTISGQGEMDDFPDGAPWEQYRSQITRVVLSGPITYIGERAFRDYDALTSVEFGSALYEIGTEAFAFCDGLTVIFLPATFKVFGEASFQNCKNLTEIHSEGRFPTFRQNSLWDTYATIYYPAENPWGLEYIDQLEEAFHGRIQFLASDGSDPHTPEIPPESEPTETATTETVTTETEPTQTETEQTDSSETVPAQTATEHSVPTSSVPTPKPQTFPSQELDPEPEKDDPKQLIMMVTLLVAVTFAFLAVLMLTLTRRKKRRKKGRFSR